MATSSLSTRTARSAATRREYPSKSRRPWSCTSLRVAPCAGRFRVSERSGEYAAWILDYLDSGQPVVGYCQQVCESMLRAFPELELRGGSVRTPLGRDLHYWLRSPSGAIVDPTEAQFGKLSPDDYDDAGTTDARALLKRVLILWTNEPHLETISSGSTFPELPPSDSSPR